jgi:hypothetical protein
LLTAIESARSNPTHHHRVHVDDIDAAIAFIRSRFVDVDWDPFPDRITIFGDDSSVEGDEDEGRFVIHIMRPVILNSNPYAE